jgi:hypothetical protein
MKTSFFILIFAGTFILSQAQQTKIDSLITKLESTHNDTMRLVLFGLLENSYHDKNNDSAFYYSSQEFGLAQRLHYRLDEAHALAMMAYNRPGNIGSLNLLLQEQRLQRTKKTKKIFCHLPTWKGLPTLKLIQFSFQMKETDIISGWLF